MSAELPEGVIEPLHWGATPIPLFPPSAGAPAVDDAVIMAMRLHGIVGCAVTVTRDDTVVHSRGYGYAELPSGLSADWMDCAELPPGCSPDGMGCGELLSGRSPRTMDGAELQPGRSPGGMAGDEHTAVSGPPDGAERAEVVTSSSGGELGAALGPRAGAERFQGVGMPFLPTTASRCGSLAKPITALCALLLADRGLLDLDAPIVPLLAAIGIRPRPVGGGAVDPRVGDISVRHLMDHTSGLPGSAAYTAWRPGRDLAAMHGLTFPATGADAAADALATHLDSDPGTAYQYANANFVLLARVIEGAAAMPFARFLASELVPAFGLSPNDVFVSRNQDTAESAARSANESAYYQTSAERYVSYEPSQRSAGQTLGEAYLGYATETADGAGGIACTARGLGIVLTNLRSSSPAISAWAMQQIATPPAYLTATGGLVTEHSFYSKGFNVRLIDGVPWLSHGGMTNHCGGIIGHGAGFQYAAVSNWNSPAEPYVHAILDHALSRALDGLR